MIIPFNETHIEPVMISQPELYKMNFKNIVINEEFFEPIIEWYELALEGHLHAYVYEKEGAVIGFYLFQHQPGIAYLMQMFVHQKWRGKRIGVELLRHFENEAKKKNAYELYLHASASNQKAVSFYRMFGFQPIQIEEQEDERRYLMIKN